MTTGELIKILADYCPDTPVDVQVVFSDVDGVEGMYPSYNDTTDELHLRWAKRQQDIMREELIEGGL